MDSKGTQPCVYMYPFAPQRGFLGRKGRPRDRQNQEVGNRQELRGPLLSLVSSLRLHSEVETETQTGKCLAEPTGSRAPLGMRRALSVGPRDQRLMLAGWYCLWPVSSPTRKPSGLHWLNCSPEGPSFPQNPLEPWEIWWDLKLDRLVSSLRFKGKNVKLLV